MSITKLSVIDMMTEEAIKSKVNTDNEYVNGLGSFEFHCRFDSFTWYDGDELVATVQLDNDNGVSWIRGAYVSPTYRKKGLGKDLIQFALLVGGKRLEVRRDNVAALSLYKKFGFVTFDEDDESLHMKINDDNDK